MKQIVLVLLFSLALIACGPLAGTDRSSSPTQSEMVSNMPTSTVVPQTVTESPSPTVEPTATVRIVMIATNPETFIPAAGRPQLIEFFAFW